MLALGSLTSETLLPVPYRYARKGGGEAVEGSMPVLCIRVSGLPAELDGLMLASDLQGRELLPPTRRNSNSPARNFREGRRLLGEVAAAKIAELSEGGRLPPSHRLGIVLAGDLWAEPGSIRRGRSGDVRAVWQAFRTAGRWVAGVRGNHDVFVEQPSDCTAGIHMLDGNTLDLDCLRIGGIGGVIGNPTNPRTRTEQRFIELIRTLAASGLDLLVLHHGPQGSAQAAWGSRSVREAVASLGCLVVFGHCWWQEPIEKIFAGPWLVNVDTRILILLREGWEPTSVG